MKEETKCYCGHTTYCDCGPETLEETAKRLYPTDYEVKSKDIINIIKQDTFINGAKWQQERSYSEEEIKNLTELFLSYYFKTDKGFDDSFDEWFEQFKKK